MEFDSIQDYNELQEAYNDSIKANKLIREMEVLCNIYEIVSLVQISLALSIPLAIAFALTDYTLASIILTLYSISLLLTKIVLYYGFMQNKKSSMKDLCTEMEFKLIAMDKYKEIYDAREDFTITKLKFYSSYDED